MKVGSKKERIYENLKQQGQKANEGSKKKERRYDKKKLRR